MKRFLIAIIILIGSFSLVGLIEKLNQTVAYDDLFYIHNTSVKIYRTKKLNNGSRVTGSAI